MGRVKFCKDCAHHNAEDGQHYCIHVDLSDPETDLVTGETRMRAPLCRDVRADEALCGEYAKWFEPKA